MILLHVVCMLLGYAGFLTAFVSGVLFLIQERQLKRKRMGSLFRRLPSLEGLDRVNFASIAAGFAFLSAGTVLGFANTRMVLGRWWVGDPKEVLTLGLWGWYLILWLVRLRSTLRGRRVALLSVLGFSFVLFTVVGASFLWSSTHPYDTASSQAKLWATEGGH